MAKKTDNNTIMILAGILVIVLSVTGILLKKYGEELKTSFSRELARLESSSEGTEVADIEKDLMETDLTGLDAELVQIEAELTAAY